MRIFFRLPLAAIFLCMLMLAAPVQAAQSPAAQPEATQVGAPPQMPPVLQAPTQGTQPPQTGQVITAPATTQPAPAAPTTASLENVTGMFNLTQYFEMIGLLFLLLGVLWFIVWILKRRVYRNTAGSAPTMYIESRLALAPKKWVVITRFQNKRFLLGMTDERITLLSELDVDTLPVNEDEKDNAFAAFLERSQGKTF